MSTHDLHHPFHLAGVIKFTSRDLRPRSRQLPSSDFTRDATNGNGPAVIAHTPARAIVVATLPAVAVNLVQALPSSSSLSILEKEDVDGATDLKEDGGSRLYK